MNDQVTWELLEDGTSTGAWWHTDPDSSRLVCDLCPRECHLKPGDRGFCFVRENRNGQMVLSTYGRSTGFCIDPIEKKPLNHFYPGSSVLSFGTAGCNLGCKFCQNWDISKSREVARLSDQASPELIAEAAAQLGCKSVAFTYNDPVIWAEYAIDTAKACRDRGVKSVAVTAGYIMPQARPKFFEHMDAANVDLKAFTEEFYQKVTYSHLQPVLDTLVYLKKETDVWFEITNLVIPQENDDRDELSRMCDWILNALGPDVPVHFSAFHPDYRMMDRPRTPHETLVEAQDIACRIGINFVYIGNVHDSTRQNTHCPNCKNCLIERNWYQLGQYSLSGNSCGKCGQTIAGRFDSVPGNWGPRRQPVRLDDFRAPVDIQSIPIQQSQPSSSPEVIQISSYPSLPVRSQPMSTPVTDSPSPASTVGIPDLNADQMEAIKRVTSRFIVNVVTGKVIGQGMFEELGELANQQVMGAFVTLKRGNLLRGWCGLLGQPIALVDALYNAAERTAKEDVRMPAISITELPYLSLDITILGPLQNVAYSGRERMTAVEIGRHGLRIARGQNAGLLLPSVAAEQGWNVEEFLQGVCRKAGLADDAWLSDDSRLEIFEGLPIHGQIVQEEIEKASKQPTSIVTIEQLNQLRGLAVQNIQHLRKGSTPSYVVPGLPDGKVNGIVLSLIDMATKNVLAHLIRISTRPGIPLQNTLFELTQTAVRVISQITSKSSMQIETALTLLYDPAMHGQVKSMPPRESSESQSVPAIEGCDLDGIDTSRRAILTIMGGSRVAIAFDSQKTPLELLYDASDAIAAHGRALGVYSMATISTRPNLIAASVPGPQTGPGTRPPAVAGAFYPSDDGPRQDLVDALIAGSVEKKRPVLAIMTPHAGLKYSGRIAADVWRRIQIPDSVLIISPKHTAHGVDWAVAPHRKWQLSKKVAFESDQSLAEAIAKDVVGMQLDSAAHSGEHGIEVQLPILERLAPSTRVTGITMQSGTLEEVQLAAKQLAEVLKRFSPMPLLVISSDMNHFASEEENRRLDRLALDALKTRDPKTLLTVCQSNRISMCGLLPALLILQTLHELGQPFRCEEVGYSTSAKVSGDTTRVVGYAGMLLVANTN